MRYSLWHWATGNLIGDFDTEAAALAAVRDELAANDDADSLVLQLDRAGREPEFIASGCGSCGEGAQARPSGRRLLTQQDGVTSAVRPSDTRLGVATAVRCLDRWLIVTLSSGREMRVPLADYPGLAEATPAQRGNVQIEAAGTSIYWPDVDEDIGVAQLLGVSEEDLYRFAGFTIHSSRPRG